MKLNFWQILGVILILVYLILWMSGIVGKKKESPTPNPPVYPDTPAIKLPATTPSE